MKRIRIALPLVLTLMVLDLWSADTLAAKSTRATLVAEANPPARGFLADESDPEAIALADRVMLRLGGREAWDATRFVTWKFFGNRLHVWDRDTGDIRVEGTDRETKESYLILMNLETKQGRAWRAGEEIKEPSALAELLELGESAWINDGYWMFMPYKLKDTGVALDYLGEKTMLDGRPARVLELTFREVGRTPENKYQVYIADDSGLVEQWDFFTQASDEKPRFQVPWRNWRRYGSILLSDDRGRVQHTDIAVLDSVPEEVFLDAAPVNIADFPRADTVDLAEAPIYSVEGNVVKPVLNASVAPGYTEEARKARTEGLVVVRTVIGQDGSIRDAWLTQKLEETLDQAALDAVRQWKFEPATLDGAPVRVYYDLTINFELDGNETEKGDTE